MESTAQYLPSGGISGSNALIFLHLRVLYHIVHVFFQFDRKNVNKKIAGHIMRSTVRGKTFPSQISNCMLQSFD
jgi:hypothetical protein